MTKTVLSTRYLVLTGLILLAACTRALPLYIPHIWNFTAVGALAIFAGAQFQNRGMAVLVPLMAMAVSDMFLGNGFNLVVYIGFIVMVGCGMAIRGKVTPTSIAVSSVTGAIFFFLITNFAFLYPWYPHNMSGVIQSYVMGLPFLRNMIIADAIYGTILFGGFYLLEKGFPKLAMVRA